jgi:hypothetical protein
MLALGMLLSALAAPAGATELAGPPAPRSRCEVLGQGLKSREVLGAERAWRWYAGAWGLNAASTPGAVLSRGPDTSCRS